MSRPQGHSTAGKIRLIEKSNELIENRTRDLPACSIVPQPTAPPRIPVSHESRKNLWAYTRRQTSRPCQILLRQSEHLCLVSFRLLAHLRRFRAIRNLLNTVEYIELLPCMRKGSGTNLVLETEHVSTCSLCSFLPRRWRRYVPSKRRQHCPLPRRAVLLNFRFLKLPKGV
jgi:hypothetical protein